MSESLHIPTSTDRDTLYRTILPQIEAIVQGETNLTANLANIAAVLKEALDFFWVGFYLVDGKELVLGPFQGPLACTRITKGKGVCGTAWQQQKTVLVADVEQFPGHIACSSESRSEIVVPVFNSKHEVVMVIDVDSKMPDDFTSVDERYLTDLAKIITRLL